MGLMKQIFSLLILLVLLFSGCAQKGVALLQNAPKTYLLEDEFNQLPAWQEEQYESALATFVASCTTSKTRQMYDALCDEAFYTTDAKLFLQEKFKPYKIVLEDEKESLLTGYYEPLLHGSLRQSERFKYPIYEVPDDLISVDLTSIYPELKNYRLRGRIDGNKLVPYYTRAESNELNASVICYTDSKIDLFFLEVQGSGRVLLDTNETLYIGYANQNGHRYKAIGKYLVKIGAMSLEEVSLQNIKAWLEANPERMDEVLNYNDSVVYFAKREEAASGALGVVLTPKRSVAIDKRYIPLGSMLYLDAEVGGKSLSQIVLAQDTGGAIKGSVRADLFLGYGAEAMEIAGKLKAPLNLWILLPKKEEL
jgi:membrane-bound lytic murein transglycosylase A